MYHEREVIALIPARGGSKGVPRKNLLTLGGVSLVELAFKSAKSCEVVDSIYISTDDKEIRDLALRLGANVHSRSASSSKDSSTATDLVTEFIRDLGKHLGEKDPLLVYLQPTSPFRNWQHLDNAFKALEIGNSFRSVSVVEDVQTPFKSVRLDLMGRILPLLQNGNLSQNRQDLPKTYRPNGAIYIFPLSAFLEGNTFPIEGSTPFMMSLEDSVDIDTYADLARANEIWERRNG